MWQDLVRDLPSLSPGRESSGSRKPSPTSFAATINYQKGPKSVQDQLSLGHFGKQRKSGICLFPMHVLSLLQQPTPPHNNCREKKPLGAQVREKCHGDFCKVLICVVPVSRTYSWGLYAHGQEGEKQDQQAESTQLPITSLVPCRRPELRDGISRKNANLCDIQRSLPTHCWAINHLYTKGF